MRSYIVKALVVAAASLPIALAANAAVAQTFRNELSFSQDLQVAEHESHVRGDADVHIERGSNFIDELAALRNMFHDFRMNRCDQDAATNNDNDNVFVPGVSEQTL